MENQHEMNFFDLCSACGRAIGRCCRKCWEIFERMIRLTYHYWWLVMTLALLGVAAAFYYTRKENTLYRANAIALLNGPTISQFEQAYEPLRSVSQLPDEFPLKELIKDGKVTAFETYRVIDCLGDSTADYVDFHRISSPTDTVKIQMKDHLCLQFRIKERDLKMLPEVEEYVMEWLNSNGPMQRMYETFVRGLQSEVEFNHSQISKLDSLTTEYYFHSHPGSEPLGAVGSGIVFMGDWRVHLFLTDIYDHQARTNLFDRRLKQATAPVVLENHFAVAKDPVNGRKKCIILFFLLGWIGGCVLAEIIDRRKEIIAWLEKK